MARHGNNIELTAKRKEQKVLRPKSSPLAERWHVGHSYCKGDFPPGGLARANHSSLILRGDENHSRELGLYGFGDELPLFDLHYPGVVTPYGFEVFIDIPGPDHGD